MKCENISTPPSLSELESVSLLEDQDPELDFLDQLSSKEFTASPATIAQDTFISSRAALTWTSSQPTATEAERSIELSENYLESVNITLQMLSSGEIDQAPAILDVQQQLQRVRQELSQLSSQHLDTQQRNQVRQIRLRLTQLQSLVNRSEIRNLPTSIIPTELLTQNQLPRPFQRMAEIRELYTSCDSPSEAWRLVEQLRVLENQIHHTAPQIIWRQGEETRVFNIADLQEEIRTLRRELLMSIRTR